MTTSMDNDEISNSNHHLIPEFVFLHPRKGARNNDKNTATTKTKNNRDRRRQLLHMSTTRAEIALIRNELQVALRKNSSKDEQYYMEQALKRRRWKHSASAKTTNNEYHNDVAPPMTEEADDAENYNRGKRKKKRARPSMRAREQRYRIIPDSWVGQTITVHPESAKIENYPSLALLQNKRASVVNVFTDRTIWSTPPQGSADTTKDTAPLSMEVQHQQIALRERVLPEPFMVKNFMSKEASVARTSPTLIGSYTNNSVESLIKRKKAYRSAPKRKDSNDDEMMEANKLVPQTLEQLFDGDLPMETVASDQKHLPIHDEPLSTIPNRTLLVEARNNNKYCSNSKSMGSLPVAMLALRTRSLDMQTSSSGQHLPIHDEPLSIIPNRTLLAEARNNNKYCSISKPMGSLPVAMLAIRTRSLDMETSSSGTYDLKSTSQLLEEIEETLKLSSGNWDTNSTTTLLETMTHPSDMEDELNASIQKLKEGLVPETSRDDPYFSSTQSLLSKDRIDCPVTTTEKNVEDLAVHDMIPKNTCRGDLIATEPPQVLEREKVNQMDEVLPISPVVFHDQHKISTNLVFPTSHTDSPRKERVKRQNLRRMHKSPHSITHTPVSIIHRNIQGNDWENKEVLAAPNVTAPAILKIKVGGIDHLGQEAGFEQSSLEVEEEVKAALNEFRWSAIKTTGEYRASSLSTDCLAARNIDRLLPKKGQIVEDMIERDSVSPEVVTHILTATEPLRLISPEVDELDKLLLFSPLEFHDHNNQGNRTGHDVSQTSELVMDSPLNQNVLHQTSADSVKDAQLLISKSVKDNRFDRLSRNFKNKIPRIRSESQLDSGRRKHVPSGHNTLKRLSLGQQQNDVPSKETRDCLKDNEGFCELNLESVELKAVPVVMENKAICEANSESVELKSVHVLTTPSTQISHGKADDLEKQEIQGSEVVTTSVRLKNEITKKMPREMESEKSQPEIKGEVKAEIKNWRWNAQTTTREGDAHPSTYGFKENMIVSSSTTTEEKAEDLAVLDMITPETFIHTEPLHILETRKRDELDDLLQFSPVVFHDQRNQNSSMDDDVWTATKFDVGLPPNPKETCQIKAVSSKGAQSLVPKSVSDNRLDSPSRKFKIDVAKIWSEFQVASGGRKQVPSDYNPSKRRSLSQQVKVSPANLKNDSSKDDEACHEPNSTSLEPKSMHVLPKPSDRITHGKVDDLKYQKKHAPTLTRLKDGATKPVQFEKELNYERLSFEVKDDGKVMNKNLRRNGITSTQEDQAHPPTERNNDSLFRTTVKQSEDLVVLYTIPPEHCRSDLTATEPLNVLESREVDELDDLLLFSPVVFHDQNKEDNSVDPLVVNNSGSDMGSRLNQNVAYDIKAVAVAASVEGAQSLFSKGVNDKGFDSPSRNFRSEMARIWGECQLNSVERKHVPSYHTPPKRLSHGQQLNVVPLEKSNIVKEDEAFHEPNSESLKPKTDHLSLKPSKNRTADGKVNALENHDSEGAMNVTTPTRLKNDVARKAHIDNGSSLVQTVSEMEEGAKVDANRLDEKTVSVGSKGAHPGHELLKQRSHGKHLNYLTPMVKSFASKDDEVLFEPTLESKEVTTTNVLRITRNTFSRHRTPSLALHQHRETDALEIKEGCTATTETSTRLKNGLTYPEPIENEVVSVQSFSGTDARYSENDNGRSEFTSIQHGLLDETLKANMCYQESVKKTFTQELDLNDPASSTTLPSEVTRNLSVKKNWFEPRFSDELFNPSLVPEIQNEMQRDKTPLVSSHRAMNFDRFPKHEELNQKCDKVESVSRGLAANILPSLESEKLQNVSLVQSNQRRIQLDNEHVPKLNWIMFQGSTDSESSLPEQIKEQQSSQKVAQKKTHWFGTDSLLALLRKYDVDTLEALVSKIEPTSGSITKSVKPLCSGQEPGNPGSFGFLHALEKQNDREKPQISILESSVVLESEILTSTPEKLCSREHKDYGDNSLYEFYEDNCAPASEGRLTQFDHVSEKEDCAGVEWFDHRQGQRWGHYGESQTFEEIKIKPPGEPSSQPSAKIHCREARPLKHFEVSSTTVDLKGEPAVQGSPRKVPQSNFLEHLLKKVGPRKPSVSTAIPTRIPSALGESTIPSFRRSAPVSLSHAEEKLNTDDDGKSKSSLQLFHTKGPCDQALFESSGHDIRNSPPGENEKTEFVPVVSPARAGAKFWAPEEMVDRNGKKELMMASEELHSAPSGQGLPKSLHYVSLQNINQESSIEGLSEMLTFSDELKSVPCHAAPHKSKLSHVVSDLKSHRASHEGGSHADDDQIELSVKSESVKTLRHFSGYRDVSACARASVPEHVEKKEEEPDIIDSIIESKLVPKFGKSLRPSQSHRKKAPFRQASVKDVPTEILQENSIECKDYIGDSDTAEKAELIVSKVPTGRAFSKSLAREATNADTIVQDQGQDDFKLASEGLKCYHSEQVVQDAPTVMNCSNTLDFNSLTESCTSSPKVAIIEVQDHHKGEPFAQESVEQTLEGGQQGWPEQKRLCGEETAIAEEVPSVSREASHGGGSMHVPLEVDSLDQDEGWMETNIGGDKVLLEPSDPDFFIELDAVTLNHSYTEVINEGLERCGENIDRMPSSQQIDNSSSISFSIHEYSEAAVCDAAPVLEQMEKKEEESDIIDAIIESRNNRDNKVLVESSDPFFFKELEAVTLNNSYTDVFNDGLEVCDENIYRIPSSEQIDNSSSITFSVHEYCQAAVCDATPVLEQMEKKKEESDIIDAIIESRNNGDNNVLVESSDPDFFKELEAMTLNNSCTEVFNDGLVRCDENIDRIPSSQQIDNSPTTTFTLHEYREAAVCDGAPEAVTLNNSHTEVINEGLVRCDENIDRIPSSQQIDNSPSTTFTVHEYREAAVCDGAPVPEHVEKEEEEPDIIDSLIESKFVPKFGKSLRPSQAHRKKAPFRQASVKDVPTEISQENSIECKDYIGDSDTAEKAELIVPKVPTGGRAFSKFLAREATIADTIVQDQGQDDFKLASEGLKCYHSEQVVQDAPSVMNCSNTLGCNSLTESCTSSPKIAIIEVQDHHKGEPFAQESVEQTLEGGQQCWPEQKRLCGEETAIAEEVPSVSREASHGGGSMHVPLEVDSLDQDEGWMETNIGGDKVLVEPSDPDFFIELDAVTLNHSCTEVINEGLERCDENIDRMPSSQQIDNSPSTTFTLHEYREAAECDGAPVPEHVDKEEKESAIIDSLCEPKKSCTTSSKIAIIEVQDHRKGEPFAQEFVEQTLEGGQQGWPEQKRLCGEETAIAEEVPSVSREASHGGGSMHVPLEVDSLDQDEGWMETNIGGDKVLVEPSDPDFFIELDAVTLNNSYTEVINEGLVRCDENIDRIPSSQQINNSPSTTFTLHEYREAAECDGAPVPEHVEKEEEEPDIIDSIIESKLVPKFGKSLRPSQSHRKKAPFRQASVKDVPTEILQENTIECKDYIGDSDTAEKAELIVPKVPTGGRAFSKFLAREATIADTIVQDQGQDDFKLASEGLKCYHSEQVVQDAPTVMNCTNTLGYNSLTESCTKSPKIAIIEVQDHHKGEPFAQESVEQTLEGGQQCWPEQKRLCGEETAIAEEVPSVSREASHGGGSMHVPLEVDSLDQDEGWMESNFAGDKVLVEPSDPDFFIDLDAGTLNNSYTEVINEGLELCEEVIEQFPSPEQDIFAASSPKPSRLKWLDRVSIWKANRQSEAGVSKNCEENEKESNSSFTNINIVNTVQDPGDLSSFQVFTETPPGAILVDTKESNKSSSQPSLSSDELNQLRSGNDTIEKCFCGALMGDSPRDVALNNGWEQTESCCQCSYISEDLNSCAPSLHGPPDRISFSGEPMFMLSEGNKVGDLERHEHWSELSLASEDPQNTSSIPNDASESKCFGQLSAKEKQSRTQSDGIDTPKNGKTYQVTDFTFIDQVGNAGFFSGSLSLDFDVPEGFGKMVYNHDGLVYEGEWKGGYWDGCGTLCEGNGDCYLGEFVKGQLHGQGTQSRGAGKYVGTFTQGVRHGHGTFAFSDGSIYVGEFEDGDKNGWGRCDFPEGGYYEGEWKNNMFEGVGECVWPDGRSYKGEFRHNEPYGFGIETFPDGRIFHHAESPGI